MIYIRIILETGRICLEIQEVEPKNRKTVSDKSGKEQYGQKN